MSERFKEWGFVKQATASCCFIWSFLTPLSIFIVSLFYCSFIVPSLLARILASLCALPVEWPQNFTLESSKTLVILPLPGHGCCHSYILVQQARQSRQSCPWTHLVPDRLLHTFIIDKTEQQSLVLTVTRHPKWISYICSSMLRGILIIIIIGCISPLVTEALT